MVQSYSHLNVTSGGELRKEMASCVGSLDTLSGTAVGGTKRNAARGEKTHLDRAFKRERDEGNRESVAMGSTKATADEEYRAGRTKWKTAGMLVDIGCSGQIMTKMMRCWILCSFNR